MYLMPAMMMTMNERMPVRMGTKLITGLRKVVRILASPALGMLEFWWMGGNIVSSST